MTNGIFKTTIKCSMDTTQTNNLQTVNITDVRFRLGAILNELQRKKTPILLISRSKPRAWLYPYEEVGNVQELFTEWYKQILPKYKKAKAKDLISLIRKDRDSR